MIACLLKNSNIQQVETGKNLVTTLYSEITKPESYFDKTKTIKKAKITKQAHAFNVQILNSFNLELHLKNTESSIKTKSKIS